jgi:hypothetical protein
MVPFLRRGGMGIYDSDCHIEDPLILIFVGDGTTKAIFRKKIEAKN